MSTFEHTLVAFGGKAEADIEITGSGSLSTADIIAKATEGTVGILGEWGNLTGTELQKEQPVGEESKSRVRFIRSSPLRRNTLWRYLNRFRSILLQGTTLQFQSSYWQEPNIRLSRHSIAQSVSSDGFTLALAIANDAVPGDLRLEIWMLEGSRLLSEWIIHNPPDHIGRATVIDDNREQAALLLWGQYAGAYSTNITSRFDMVTTPFEGQYWDRMTARGQFMVLSSRKKLRPPSKLGGDKDSSDPPSGSGSLPYDETCASRNGLAVKLEVKSARQELWEPSDFSDEEMQDDTPEAGNLFDGFPLRNFYDEAPSIEFEPDTSDTHASEAVSCAICDSAVFSAGLYCENCSGGGFALCEDCFDAGYWCNDSEHTLLENPHGQLLLERSWECPVVEEALGVYDGDALQDQNYRLFSYRRCRKSSHFDSFPLLHPETNVVAWYMSDSTILFFDPRTKKSRFVDLGYLVHRVFAARIYYSTTGDFLHVIAIGLSPESAGESFGSDIDTSAAESSQAEYLLIRVWCATYQVSPSDSAPFTSEPLFYLSFGTRVGRFRHVSQIPLEVTWNDQEAYLAINDSHLKLYKINLFGQDMSIGDGGNPVTDVQKPRKLIHLPDTAVSRIVQYIPKTQGAAIFLIGAKSMRLPSLPFAVKTNVISDWVSLGPGKNLADMKMPKIRLALNAHKGEVRRTLRFDDIAIPMRFITDDKGGKLYMSGDGVLKLVEAEMEYKISFHWDADKTIHSTVQFLTPQSIYSGFPGPSIQDSAVPFSAGGDGGIKQRYPVRMSTFAPFSWLAESGMYWRVSDEDEVNSQASSDVDFGLCGACSALRLKVTDFLRPGGEDERQDFVVYKELSLPGHSTHTITCNVCQRKLWSPCITYWCGVCADGDFDLCEWCWRRGAHCLNSSHKLRRRREDPQFQDRIIRAVLESKVPNWQGKVGTLREIQERSYCPLCRIIEASINARGWAVAYFKADRRGDLLSTGYDQYASSIKVHLNWIEYGWNASMRQTQGRYLVPWSEHGAIGNPLVLLSESSPFSMITGCRLETRQVHFPMLKAWLKDCEDNHGPQCNSSVQPYLRPVRNFRVIDVQDMCLVHLTIAMRFIALSYVWGGPQELKAEKKNIRHLESKDSLRDLYDKIPRTIRDAIHLLTKLGERYLWVDALCIVQDDEDEASHLIGVMDLIYGCANFTIVAASGQGVTAGLPGVQIGSRLIKQDIAEVAVGVKLMVLPSLAKSFSSSVYYTRGWTFQEQIMSRRRLVFTDSRIYLQCECRVYREDFCPDKPDVVCHLLQDSDRATSLSSYFGSKTGRVFGPGGGYERLVSNYLTRSLTKDDDIFRAFSGVLNLLETKLSFKFIAALPVNRLDSSIIFTTKRTATRRESFPSFSWLGWKGEVNWPESEHTQHPFLSQAVADKKEWFLSDTYIEWYEGGTGMRPKVVANGLRPAYSWLLTLLPKLRPQDDSRDNVERDLMGRPINYKWRSRKGKEVATEADEEETDVEDGESGRSENRSSIRETLPLRSIDTQDGWATGSLNQLGIERPYLLFQAVTVQVLLYDQDGFIQSDDDFRYVSLKTLDGETVGFVTVSDQLIFTDGVTATAVVLSNIPHDNGVARSRIYGGRPGDDTVLFGPSEYEAQLQHMLKSAYNIMLIEWMGQVSERIGAGFMIRSAVKSSQATWRDIILV